MNGKGIYEKRKRSHCTCHPTAPIAHQAYVLILAQCLRPLGRLLQLLDLSHPPLRQLLGHSASSPSGVELRSEKGTRVQKGDREGLVPGKDNPYPKDNPYLLLATKPRYENALLDKIWGEAMVHTGGHSWVTPHLTASTCPQRSSANCSCLCRGSTFMGEKCDLRLLVGHEQSDCLQWDEFS